MRVISIQTLCAPLESILICSFLVAFAIKFNRCSHFLHCLVWGMSSDVEAFFKHGDYLLVYEKDGPLQIQGRYGSNKIIEGLKASLEGVAISGRLLGLCTKPDGTLKFLKIEIAPPPRALQL